MCGRFSLFEPIETLQEKFDFEFSKEFAPRYNIAPGQDILAVLPKGTGRGGAYLRWGFIPAWAQDEAIGYKMINARAETLSEKISFKNSFKQKRCIILSDGFYEWKREGKLKKPYRFVMKDRKPFAMAGLWERWNKNGSNIFTCTIITTEANAVTKEVHDRMPVVLTKEAQQVWLSKSIEDPEQLKSLLCPYSSVQMELFEVSSELNSAKNEGIQLIEPLNSK
ncbi:SOS response-associated peptidase [Mesobacillus harenae]|uniref:SOS response-associated peptidase n=1 Tax=Mesobacillus harenae TaxID=2213203 RepID=UPI001580A26A|nr:SOS response-associated peptidase [Mesobacillus harenae]